MHTVGRATSSAGLVNYTALPYNAGMEFIETSLFTKLIYTYLTDDEYLGLQGFMLKYPEAGNIVPGSGGVRKLRWSIAGKGKRGGVRVIYYLRKHHHEIWMLTIYGKSDVENIPPHILRQIAEEIKNV
jgi:mRNA-degrading endonuclease RelE of RelBE toxin-antitoxin system